MNADEKQEGLMPRWMHWGLIVLIAVMTLWTWWTWREKERRMDESLRRPAKMEQTERSEK